MSDVMKWLGAVALIVSIANTIWVWVTKGSRDQALKVEKLAVDLDVHDSRIQSIEGELKHLPSKDAVNELLLQVERLNGKLGTQEAEVASVGRTVRRIEDHLLGVRAA